MLKRTRQIGKGTIFKTRTRVSLASVLERFPRDALLGERNRTNGSDMLHAIQWLSKSIAQFIVKLPLCFHQEFYFIQWWGTKVVHSLPWSWSICGQKNTAAQRGSARQKASPVWRICVSAFSDGYFSFLVLWFLLLHLVSVQERTSIAGKGKPYRDQFLAWIRYL